MLDKPSAYTRTDGEPKVEYPGEATEYLCARAGGSAVAEIGRGGRLEGGPATKEAFDDGCNEKEIGPVFGKGR
jgi:hypothetical protein